MVEFAVSVLNQWRNIQDRTLDPFTGYIPQDDGDKHWSLPIFNNVNFHSDAAIFDESSCFNHVFVARDYESRLMKARSKCLRWQSSPDMAEAIGTRESLSWIKDRVDSDHNTVVVGSDCLRIVQAVHISFMCFSYIGRMIK